MHRLSAVDDEELLLQQREAGVALVLHVVEQHLVAKCRPHLERPNSDEDYNEGEDYDYSCGLSSGHVGMVPNLLLTDSMVFFRK